MRWQQKMGKNNVLKSHAFYLFRDFRNRLSFESGGAVRLFRNFAGAGIALQSNRDLASRYYQSVLGLDVEWQSDNRRRYDNLNGRFGPLTFDQNEGFSSAGIYWIQKWTPMLNLWLQTALRYDINYLVVKDQLLSDGDQSGAIDYHNLSPSIGLSYIFCTIHSLYGNYRPDNTGGFNEQLKPQNAYNYELGIKGRIFSMLDYQAAAFYLRLNNELVPYELSTSPGRLFYRNAGITLRKGVETRLYWKSLYRITGRLSYTYSHFRYKDFIVLGEQYKGNSQPGIPEHMLTGQLMYDYSKTGTILMEGRWLSRIYADDANQSFTEPFPELNLRLNQQVTITRYHVTCYGGLNNIFNTDYADNIRINASGGRYFEAAPGINFYLGFQASRDIE